MRYLAHESRLHARDEHGVSYRTRLQASANKGNAEARALLTEEVPYPEEIAYLHGWALELVGASGEGMTGAAPLSWATIDAWASRTKRTPSVDECQALRMVDSALRRPDLVDEATDATDDADEPGGDLSRRTLIEIPAWPKQSEEPS